MAGSAFEQFVQQELPLRPFTPTDGNLESIPVRRGQGPRQLQFIDLTDGQVLARVNGQLQGVTLNNLDGNGNAGGVRHFIADVAEGSEMSTWTLVHNLASFNCVVQAYQLNVDGSYQSVIPDLIKLVDNDTVELKFSMPIAGKAILSFVD
jgi:hypothetical protein